MAVLNFKNIIEEATLAHCWIDYKKIESGAPSYAKEIAMAINACPIFLFMLSKASQESEYAKNELKLANEKRQTDKKKVVVVNIEQSEMSDELKILCGLANTIDWSDPLQNKKLIHDIRQWIGTEALGNTPKNFLISKLSEFANRFPMYKEEINDCINSIVFKNIISHSDIDTPIFENRFKKFN